MTKIEADLALPLGELSAKLTERENAHTQRVSKCKEKQNGLS